MLYLKATAIGLLSRVACFLRSLHATSFVDAATGLPHRSMPISDQRFDLPVLCAQDRDWLLVLGSGIAGQGGALLLYRSRSLSSGTIVFHSSDQSAPSHKLF